MHIHWKFHTTMKQSFSFFLVLNGCLEGNRFTISITKLIKPHKLPILAGNKSVMRNVELGTCVQRSKQSYPISTKRWICYRVSQGIRGCNSISGNKKDRTSNIKFKKIQITDEEIMRNSEANRKAIFLVERSVFKDSKTKSNVLPTDLTYYCYKHH